MDNELLLFDRLNTIREVNKKYNLEQNAYLTLSGGKDSTILHYLLDKALPNNQIPRVFINTGIEYNEIVNYVKKLAEKDKRIIIITPKKPIKQILEQYGYPFKSKEHAKKVDQFWRTKKLTNYLKKYINEKKGRYTCPENLKYQFTNKNKIHYSHLCCQKLKKEPIQKWEKENNRYIGITGLKREEGGQRANIKGCIITNNKGKILHFHPLLVVNEEWENWYIKKEKIKLCKLYYEPFNFVRTGCKGCPFALQLQEQLTIMEIYLPIERKQCEIIWKPVYEEYRRLNYRLNKHEQLKLL